MRKTLEASVATCILITILSFSLPQGWFKAGSQLKSYEMGIDKGAGPDGKNAATIKSLDSLITGFGTLMQKCKAGKFQGKRIKMSGFVKTQNVVNWAGLWLRVDQYGSQQPLAFDNMHDRPIKGNTDWKKYEITLDVPLNASFIAFGALLEGTGQIWFDNLRFEIAEKQSRGNFSGDQQQDEGNSKPVNLDFEK